MAGTLRCHDCGHPVKAVPCDGGTWEFRCQNKGMGKIGQTACPLGQLHTVLVTGGLSKTKATAAYRRFVAEGE